MYRVADQRLGQLLWGTVHHEEHEGQEERFGQLFNRHPATPSASRIQRTSMINFNGEWLVGDLRNLRTLLLHGLHVLHGLGPVIGVGD